MRPSLGQKDEEGERERQGTVKCEVFMTHRTWRVRCPQLQKRSHIMLMLMSQIDLYLLCWLIYTNFLKQSLGTWKALNRYLPLKKLLMRIYFALQNPSYEEV